jgi:copper chaperone CopZ
MQHTEGVMILEILSVPKMRSRTDRWAITAALEAVPGVRRVLANQADRTVRVERDDDSSLAAILKAVKDAGYEVSVLA